MKKINITLMLFLTTGFLFGTVSTSAAAVPSCSELGYTKTSTECTGLPIVKCPTDTSQIFCATTCDSVKVGTYEKCTKYCAEDTNVCIAKRDMTCDEVINLSNGTKLADGSTISGTKTGHFFLMGTVKRGTNTLTLTQAYMHDAADIPACAAEMGGKVGHLDVSYIYINSFAHFFVKTTIGSLYYTPSSTSYSASFQKDADITVNFRASTSWVTPLYLTFDRSGSDDPINNVKVKIYCENYEGSSGGNKPGCHVNLGGYNANVQYCSSAYDATAYISCEVYDEMTGVNTCTESCNFY